MILFLLSDVKGADLRGAVFLAAGLCLFDKLVMGKWGPFSPAAYFTRIM